MSVDLSRAEQFVERHIGPSSQEVDRMLSQLSCDSLDELIDEAIPSSIRTDQPLDLPAARTESELFEDLRALASKNASSRSFIGLGYHGTITPPVIERGILENPGWYTQYTPYQSEISQGRLQALLNFQTMMIDLTDLEVANASLLDEGTAAAEAMSMFYSAHRQRRGRFLVAEDVHPQTLAVIETRAEPLGIEVVIADHRDFVFDGDVLGALVQYPATDGVIHEYEDLCDRAHEQGAYVAVAADPLSLTLLRPPGAFGADVALGSTQRFGVPMGYGGPYAGYFATTGEFKRKIPGRIIGVSVDDEGQQALRMALQTREQHIRRERATSNICTAQVLLAVMASMYGVYHGPEGLKKIARRIHELTNVLARGLDRLGYDLISDDYFDTVTLDVDPETQDLIRREALDRGINLRYYSDGRVGVSLDEPTTRDELQVLLDIFASAAGDTAPPVDEVAEEVPAGYNGVLQRQSSYLDHPVFNEHHSETEMMRYMDHLQKQDLSLTDSMIPLGSCTMKLNPAAALMPISWPSFSTVHPFVPEDQAEGYERLIEQLSEWLAEITGFPAVSMQPNSGAQGEYAGLLTIRKYHQHRGDDHRDVCLIPESAHGTNPASAAMAGMDVVIVDCDEDGNVDVDDLREKAQAHEDRLAAMMITYPSTHGVFEDNVQELCDIVHTYGGQVYMDGANMNAQVGLCRPAEYGVDVCHLNLHKTFSIPHGGGGPGMGPICAADHLADFLPNHPLRDVGGEHGIGPVASAPWGSANILIISWAYIALLGAEGLTQASRVAILSANYMADRLEAHYPVLYRGLNDRVAHEFILDFRTIRREIGVTEEDVAKRLIDYGFHAPTMSWPVPGTMMVEPTESEGKDELDRFCDALVAIRSEIDEVAEGEVAEDNNLLRRAPHTAEAVSADEWDRPYSRERAAYPAAWSRDRKFWPSVSRVDNAFGDRNLVCACPPIDAYRADDPSEELEEAAV